MGILVIEDDAILNKNIIDALRAENMPAEGVFDGQLADRMLRREQFDCVIMDINLPGKTGFDLCRDFRKHNTETPVLLLTAFSELDDKVKGYDCGADDYLTKPFYLRELILRTQALLRRYRSGATSGKDNETLIADDIVIYPKTKKVFRRDSEVTLTPREYQVLEMLCERKGEIVSKQELIKAIWGTAFDTNTNTIEVYVNFLRNKLDKPFGKNTIKTRVGYGYYLEAE
ncbi:response regulator transcription factor [Flavihumibacter petaseus]|uniref:Putative two-component response regulator n=1 Tax=Flavihumibacter petaseus NBRC 106054 TaxID=1220578 RepID=A0A0E9N209_9BACT|nr:response regulator transcription factor [Flavihumibacter petaseus]GAO43838.1 putative two-component response regulator [Flavihumibacter petaseus NBRC 106054]